MRERLAQHYQETHIFTAQFRSYGKTTDGSNMACLGNINLVGLGWVADHIWVHRSKHMKQLALIAGDMVQFEARIGRYVRGTARPHFVESEYDYNLEKVREFIVLKRVEGLPDGSLESTD